MHGSRAIKSCDSVQVGLGLSILQSCWVNQLFSLAVFKAGSVFDSSMLEYVVMLC